MTNTLQLTTALIQRRDDLRRILGEHYGPTVADYRAVLRGLVAEENRPIAEVCLDHARRMEAAGHDPSMFLAALVEECGA